MWKKKLKKYTCKYIFNLKGQVFKFLGVGRVCLFCCCSEIMYLQKYLKLCGTDNFKPAVYQLYKFINTAL